MKKLLLILLSLTIVLSLAACGDETPEVTCEHMDINDDYVCEFCGETLPCEGNHTDANYDQKCDRCDAAVPCTLHVDENTDGKCDRCDEDMPIETITIAEAITICGTLADKTPTTERYYIKGIVKSVTNAAYGAMIVEDETGSISVYGSYGADGANGYASLEEKPYAGDEVLIYCTLQSFGGTPEINSAWIISFTHIEADISDYVDATIAEARAAETGALLKVDGVVAAITYANGKIPSGVILVDETSSIYVYDGDIAGRVAVGNKITVAGAKTYWILDTEKNNAQKFDYKGCNQLENATLVDNDEGNNEFNKTWMTETTMMDLLNTPVTEDITSLVYKVTALVKKVPGSGFTNYYFNDIDGVTGAYAYTQCNGSDFAWLDQFDGKICTVYITALNAKSTATDCYFRVLPVAVIDEGYTFDVNKAPEYAIKYHGLTQFQPSYSGDPALELLGSVSSELLGFENVILSYASSNNDIITIANEDGKIVMHCVAPGTVTITVTATHGTNSASGTFEITVKENLNYEFISVNTAINSTVGETVIVKGIVGPSLVNKTGFYLIDETGVIAVTGPAEMFDGLAIGHEIILQGVRAVNKDSSKGGNHVGQTYLKDSVILANNYGSNDYSTATFVNDKTLIDIYGLDVSVDYSTTVFVTTATITVEESTYYTNIYLTMGSTQLRLYSSSASQYNWLKQFAGQEVTVEVAACNWNDKTYYTGCVLAVILEDGSKIYNEYNFK